MAKTGFYAGDVLLPQGIDMTKWSVVACDQYTSEPEYWDEVDALVGDSPSTLRVTLPEIYLEQDGVKERIEAVNAAMLSYVESGILKEFKNSYLYVERTMRDGTTRPGLMGVVDLEEYDYRKGSQSLIRATEGTVVERIPPRLRVRENAALELPHIMLLIDDEEKTVLEPLAARKTEFDVAYDFTMMMDSGAIKGWFVDAAAAKVVDSALAALAEPGAWSAKYNVTDKGVLLFAVGDGNHSLATAKENYEQVKRAIGADAAENHPARYALVEVVNIHDPSLQFEPIHRVLFDVDASDLLSELGKTYELAESGEGQKISYVWKQGKGDLVIKNPSANLAVGTLQNFLDKYLAEKGGRIDYIHGEDVVERLGTQDGNIGFLLPNMEKSELFPTVILDGALPRKTFSMGHAYDKRFYLEARKIQK
ncbi:MAG: DUF1015 domain-containing protein [Oscillospiraceae bacterium]|nr:DUF1015 domain-containing protein [Oscillospiraceae bacterium]